MARIIKEKEGEEYAFYELILYVKRAGVNGIEGKSLNFFIYLILHFFHQMAFTYR